MSTVPVIPTKMKSLFLIKHIQDFNASDLESYFEVREVDVPKPASGEVLVKVECSPINPSDLSTLNGTYNAAQRAPLPCQIGFEGSGTVVQSGGGLMAWMLTGKRVAIIGKNVWSEYVVVDASRCIVLPDDVSFEEGCSCFVNPLTVIGFIEIAKSRGLKTILHTAAASALGKMLIKYGKEEGIEIVCVIRKEEQIKTLQQLGATHIINSSEENWRDQLKEKCTKLNILLGFDALAGPMTGEILKLMPNGAELKVYGGLSNQAVSSVSVTDLIFSDKKISGFWLTPYIGAKSIFGKKAMVDQVAKKLKTSLKTDVRVSYSLENAAAAMRDYNKTMSDGKVTFKPFLAPA